MPKDNTSMFIWIGAVASCGLRLFPGHKRSFAGLLRKTTFLLRYGYNSKLYNSGVLRLPLCRLRRRTERLRLFLRHRQQ